MYFREGEIPVESIEGYQRLAAAVIEQAVKDYRRCLRRLYRNPFDQSAKDEKAECERFFRMEKRNVNASFEEIWGCIRILMERLSLGQSKTKLMRR